MSEFTFTRIADTSGPLDALFSPAINNTGTLAFRAFLDEGGSGIFTGSGGSTTTIADSSSFETASEPLIFSGPAINDSGTVAFVVARQTIETPVFVGLFTGNGGSFTTIADADGPFSASLSAGPPSINNAGTVNWVGGEQEVGPGVFTGNGGPITTIADTGGPFSSVAINESGTVVFATPSGIFTGSGGPLTTLVDTSREPSYRLFTGASLNDQGNVAFRVGLVDQTSERIVVSGDGLTTVAEANISGNTPFVSFLSPPAINDAGTVAFEAFLGSGRDGIFTGPDPVANKVIASGDSLFGSTVTRVDFFRGGLNDAGQVAFLANFADGTRGIFRADPVFDPVDPEPIPEPTPIPQGFRLQFGGPGRDELVADQKAILFGGAGDDILDASGGEGGNRLYGGPGDDILFAGISDRLFGEDGNDILFAGKGGSILRGGNGDDQFWIVAAEIPEIINTISDFELDTDVIGIGGLPGVSRFESLCLKQSGEDTVISALGQDLAILSGIEFDNLSSGSFVFS